jgi:ABC-type Fe3+-hydroxamate transport system substrate-binding protein
LAIILALFLLSLNSCKGADAAEQERYVVLSPEVAEILSAIGARDRIVGITEECSYLTGFEEITVVGKFGMLDREKIIALNPEIIFASALEQESIAADFGKLGYRVETSYPKTVEEMFESIQHLGKICGLESEAEKLISTMRAEFEAISAKTAGLSRPRVYLEIYRDPLMSVSDQSFVGELIELAGGDNIFEVLERDYSRIKVEDVIKAAPQIMICFSRDTLENILNRKGWQRIPAIVDQNIFFEEDINPDWIQRAGPRTVLGLRRLSEIIDSVRNNTTLLPLQDKQNEG